MYWEGTIYIRNVVSKLLAKVLLRDLPWFWDGSCSDWLCRRPSHAQSKVDPAIVSWSEAVAHVQVCSWFSASLCVLRRVSLKEKCLSY